MIIDQLASQLQETGLAEYLVSNDDWKTARLEVEEAVARIGAGAVITSGRGKYKIRIITNAYKEARDHVKQDAGGSGPSRRPLINFTTDVLIEAYGKAAFEGDYEIVGHTAFEIGCRNEGRRTSDDAFLQIPYAWESSPQYLSDICPTCKSPVGELRVESKRIGIRSINAADKVREQWRDLKSFQLEGDPLDHTSPYYEEGAENHPFFSEKMLYPLVGKGDARSVLSYLRKLGEALGFDRSEA